jgi:hypothetical protein
MNIHAARPAVAVGAPEVRGRARSRRSARLAAPRGSLAEARRSGDLARHT